MTCVTEILGFLGNLREADQPRMNDVMPFLNLMKMASDIDSIEVENLSGSELTAMMNTIKRIQESRQNPLDEVFETVSTVQRKLSNSMRGIRQQARTSMHIQSVYNAIENVNESLRNIMMQIREDERSTDPLNDAMEASTSQIADQRQDAPSVQLEPIIDMDDYFADIDPRIKIEPYVLTDYKHAASAYEMDDDLPLIDGAWSAEYLREVQLDNHCYSNDQTTKPTKVAKQKPQKMTYLCRFCRLTFASKTLLAEHESKAVNPFFQCTVCGTNYKTKNGLQIHCEKKGHCPQTCNSTCD